MSLAAEAAAVARSICGTAADPVTALRAAGLLDVPDGVAVEVFAEIGAWSLPAALPLAPSDAARAAAFCGAGRAATELGTAYARERHVFGRPVSSFQVQRHAFALAAARLDAALALARRVAGGAGSPLDAAACVPVAADAAWFAADHALQVHGGYGYTDEYAVSARWLDIATERARLDRSAYDEAVAAAGGR